jgi:hypothetical protein
MNDYVSNARAWWLIFTHRPGTPLHENAWMCVPIIGEYQNCCTTRENPNRDSNLEASRIPPEGAATTTIIPSADS